MQLRNPRMEDAIPRPGSGDPIHLRRQNVLPVEAARTWRFLIFLADILIESPFAALALTMLVPVVFAI